jgi:hypothetical protein
MTTSPISCAARDSLPIRPSVCCAWSTAASPIRLDSRTRLPISSTEVESSSVAAATDCMLLDASSDAPATWLDRLCVVSAVRVAPLTIAAAESAISAVSSSISLEFSISLVSACRYSSSSAAASLRPWRIFSLVDVIACSAFSTNLRRASALAAAVWSALTTNVLASAVTA